GWEPNSNLGFSLPWWDYSFGSYRAQPAEGHEGMTIGLEQIRDERIADRLHRMLLLPFLGRPGGYPIHHRGTAAPQAKETPPRTGTQWRYSYRPTGGAMNETRHPNRPLRLLFVCRQNSRPAPMAEALARV